MLDRTTFFTIGIAVSYDIQDGVLYPAEHRIIDKRFVLQRGLMPELSHWLESLFEISRISKKLHILTIP